MARSSQPNAGDPLARHLCDRVRQLRRERGWSLDELSSACGVSRSMLSQIERNRANPTLAVAFRIAQAFGLSLAELVEAQGASPKIAVIRASDRAYHYRSDEQCRIRTLSPLHLEKDVEFYEVELQPGGALRSSAHFEGTREYVTVKKGRVRVESGGDGEVLAPGDSACYRADVPHAIVNLGRSAASLYLVDIYK
jgi:transcriptional regulator with XRE-family HTH domain